MKPRAAFSIRSVAAMLFAWALLLAAEVGAAPVDCSYLARLLLKPLPTSASDIKTPPPPPIVARVSPTFTAQQRYDAIRDWPLAAMIASPGHRNLRHPEGIPVIVNHIQTNQSFGNNKLILNLVTDSSGVVTSVDVWDAHHRMAAYIVAQYKTIGEIPVEQFELLINGKRVDGTARDHDLPISGMDPELLPHLVIAPPSPGKAPWDLAIDGRYSNFELGSRATMKEIARVNTQSGTPKVGVLFTSGAPLTKEQWAEVERRKTTLGLAEVLIVAQTPSGTIAQDSELAGQIKDRPGVNLYLGDPRPILARGDRIFQNHVRQIYVTRDVVPLAPLPN